jgi:hypothetical protein
MNMRAHNVLSSACAGEFIQIGLSADTIHRRTTMFDLLGGDVRPDHLPWQTH